ncbi:MAG: hypothetical protein KGN79_10525 [Acidobacteriota bacterium]|nr:hypothetical protein [Acidobacteriota bacterium]
MKSVWRSLAWVLPLMLAGCFHKQPQVINQPLAPPIADNFPPKPVPSPPASELPPPVISQPAEQTQTAEQKPPEKPEETPQPPKKKRKPANHSAQVASSGEGNTVSAIGQLTAGDGGDLRSQTDASIQATDKALKGITRPLNDQEKKVVAQIQEFLKQARAALGSGDVDGAHTLAAKAKVLLDELNK